MVREGFLLELHGQFQDTVREVGWERCRVRLGNLLAWHPEKALSGELIVWLIWRVVGKPTCTMLGRKSESYGALTSSDEGLKLRI
jgi:hypothetical protein